MTGGPQRNAYVRLRDHHTGRLVDGRLLDMRQQEIVLFGVPTPARFPIPQWKVAHWHNQPSEADDSWAWMATRLAVAIAMQRPGRRADAAA